MEHSAIDAPAQKSGQVVSLMLRHMYSLLAMAFLLTACLPVLAETPEEAKSRLQSMDVDISAERLIQYAAQGDMAVVKLLVDAGLDVTVADRTRQVTALHNAAAQDHLSLVNFLLDRGAVVDARDWHGNTPLIDAAFYGRATVVSVLLAHHAQTDLVPTVGPTALVAAIYSGNVDTVTALLKAGTNPNLATIDGTTPLDAAKLAGRSSILSLLQQAGAK